MSHHPDPPSPPAPRASGLKPQRAPNRLVQLAPHHAPFGREFCAEKQKLFLELFAATCNAKWAARTAGVAYSTVYRHRMLKPVFAEAWDRALEQAYARLEMKTVQQQFSPCEEELERIELTGDWDVPDPPVQDADRAMQLLKHHYDRVSKIRAGRGGEAARTEAPEIADDDQLVRELTQRLVEFSQRPDEPGECEHSTHG